jgi:hypothetical protein
MGRRDLDKTAYGFDQIKDKYSFLPSNLGIIKLLTGTLWKVIF